MPAEMDKFSARGGSALGGKNKYTIQSARLQGYDYAQNGMYFVTICAKDREHFFGAIENKTMNLSDIGKIVQEEWLKTPIIRQNVILDEWVIMPNHLHGIIEIINQPNGVMFRDDGVETPRRGVSTGKNKRGGFNPQWKPDSLGSIINQFKSICTKKFRDISKLVMLKVAFCAIL